MPPEPITATNTSFSRIFKTEHLDSRQSFPSLQASLHVRKRLNFQGFELTLLKAPKRRIFRFFNDFACLRLQTFLAEAMNIPSLLAQFRTYKLGVFCSIIVIYNYSL